MNRWKQIAITDTGSEIAEAAFILPLLFALLFGIVWFGRAFNIYATLNRAAHEGAQAAAARTCASCGNTFQSAANIQANVINPILRAAHIDPNTATINPPIDVLMNPTSSPPDPPEFGKSVTISYLYGFTLNGIQCCPLALTPVNLGVTLSATAQSRQEN